MDTSKEYTSMCRKATEIQEAWYPEVGDWTNKGLFTGVYHMLSASTAVSDKDLGFEIVEPKYGRLYCYRKELIWLPRQDQLQGMLGYQLGGMIQVFYDWIEKTVFPDSTHNSMEQLWLAFVMHEKYGKKWDGKDWTPVAHR